MVNKTIQRSLTSLFPYGKSGLKYGDVLIAVLDGGSLPVWEEWIEMSMAAARASSGSVSSRMGRVD